MVSLKKEVTERTVETRLISSRFVLLVSDAASGKSFVVPYEPSAGLFAHHVRAIANALAILAAEEIGPAGCVFEVMDRKELDGKPYWAPAALLGYSEALEVLAGRRAILTVAPNQNQAAPATDTPIGHGLTSGAANLCQPGGCPACDGIRDRVKKAS